MKKNLFSILSLTLLLIIGVACQSQTNDGSAKPAAKKEQTSPAAKGGTLPNYRYVDIDTIFLKYNLAKDYEDEMLRLQANLNAEAQKHESSIKSFANQMQTKYQNQQYTEQTYKADEQKMQKMQSNAAAALEKMQRNMITTDSVTKKKVMDEIESFVKTYNESHHYDAIFLKQTALYIDPALDITDEVVEGLNARYNKKEKK